MSGGFFAATAAPQANPYASWNGGITSTAVPQTSPQATSAVPTWGGLNDSAAWGAPQAAAQPQQQQQPSFNAWGSPTQTQQRNNSTTSNLWGQPAAADPWASPSQTTAAPAAPAQKKNDHDPFANIWG